MLCRLILDSAHDGPWNMAVDVVLLESAGAYNVAYLGFYQWSAPTLSLGYFQHYAQREQHAASIECPVVRRLSGGGAIMHDREWTYSLALPLQSPLGKLPDTTYQLVNQATVATLAELQIDAGSFCGAETSPDEEPFLCFQRRSCGDLVTCGYKIMGSAQRRRHGAILQHGSLLLGRSDAAPELPGIEELTGQTTPTRLIDLWTEQLCRKLQLQPCRYALTQAQVTSVQQLVCDKFGSAAWTRRR
jgi:lipoate-protein ligase A